MGDPLWSRALIGTFGVVTSECVGRARENYPDVDQSNLEFE